MPLASHYIAAYFGVLAVIFFILAFTRDSVPAKKSWRRIGTIFALAALAILILGPR